jgi:predicted dehydrogenase
VDFVYIVLPNSLHLDYIKNAADAGKPILCEKPLCLTAAEAAEAASYCDKKGVPLMEGFMYRFHPLWTRAMEIVKCGEIGKIIHTVSTFTYTQTDPHNIRNQIETGGGSLYDIGCYCVSGARTLFEAEPQRVVCSMNRDNPSMIDSSVSAILDFGGGRGAVFDVGTLEYADQRIAAIGTSGSFSMDLAYNPYPDVSMCMNITQKSGMRVFKTQPADMYFLEFEAFAQALIDKKPVPVPISDAVANMAVLDALFASGKSGSWENVNRY